MTKVSSSFPARSEYATIAGDRRLERLSDPAVPNGQAYTLGRRGRHWEVRDPAGTLVCVTVYKRGAAEVIRRLSN